MSKIVESAKRMAERARKAPARAAVAAMAAVALVGGGLAVAQAASGNDLIAWAQTAIEQKAGEIAYAATDGLEAVQAAMGVPNSAVGEGSSSTDGEPGAQGAAVEDGASEGASGSAAGAPGDGTKDGSARAVPRLQEDGTLAYAAASSDDGGSEDAEGGVQGFAGILGGLLGQTAGAPSPDGASGASGDGAGSADGRAGQLSIEVPSGMACAVMADGSVVVPDQPVKNTGGVDAVVKSVRLEQAASASQVLTTPDTVTWSVGHGASSWDLGGGVDGAQVDVAIAAGGEAAFSWGCELGGAALLGAGGAKFADVLYTVEAVDLEPYATLFANGTLAFTQGEPDAEQTARLGGSTEVVGQWTGFAEGVYGAREDVPWYGDRESVLRAVVDEPLAPGGMAYWFCEMANLAEVDVSRIDSSNVESFYRTFYACSSLAEVDAPNLVGTKAETVCRMFSGCTSLVKANVPSLVQAACTDASRFMENCTSLESFDVSGWDTSSVEDISCAWSDCESLTALDLSGLDVGSCESFGCMLEDCLVLASPGDLSGWDVSSGIHFDQMFDGCYAMATPGDLSAWAMGSQVKTTEGMFAHCEALTGLGDLSGWKMPANESYSRMFYDCPLLASVGDLSGWETGSATNFEQFMSGCYAIDGVGDLSGWDMSSATNIASIFRDCRALTSIGDISGWQVGGVETFRLSFSNLYSLTTLGDLGAWDMGSATTLYGMFDQSDKIETLGDLGGWNVSNVENFRGVFGGMESLKEVGDLSAWNTAKGTNFFGMFHDTLIEKLDLSGWDTRNATDMVDMLAMDYLAEITVGENFSFDGNGTLDETTRAYLPTPYPSHIPGADRKWHAKSDGAAYAPKDVPDDKADTYYAVVPEEAYATLYANGTMIFTVNEPTSEQAAEYGEGTAVSGQWSGFEDKVYSRETSVPWYDSRTAINQAIIVEGIAPFSTAYWFSGAKNMTMADVGLLDTRHVTNMNNMFYNCSKLTSLDVSSWDTSSAMNTSYMFYNCSKLTSLDVSSWDTSNIAYMGSMFYRCSGLTSLDVSSWDTSSVMEMQHLFSCCSNLESLDVSGWDTSSVVNMSFMFSECSSLTSLDISSWDTSCVTNMNYMFGECGSLTSLDLTGLDTAKVGDMSQMFYCCSNLESLDVSGWDTSSVVLMDSMFYNCSKLTSLDVSSWDTSSVMDMRQVFYGCSKLSCDCSSWNVAMVMRYTNFKWGAPYVVSPAFGAKSMSIQAMAEHMPLVAGGATSVQDENTDSESAASEGTNAVEGENGSEEASGVSAGEGVVDREPATAGEPEGTVAVDDVSGSGGSPFATAGPASGGAESADREGAFGQGEVGGIEGADAVTVEQGDTADDSAAAENATADGAAVEVAGSENADGAAAAEEGWRSPVSFGVADGKEDGEVVVEVLGESADGIAWSLTDEHGTALDWDETVDGKLDDEGGTVFFKGDGKYVLAATVVGTDGSAVISRVGMSLSLADGDEYGIDLGPGYSASSALEAGPANEADGAAEPSAEGADVQDGSSLQGTGQVSAVVAQGETVSARTEHLGEGHTESERTLQGGTTFRTAGATADSALHPSGPAATWTTRGRAA